MEQFFDMGGYARFVWPSFALAFAVIGWNVWSARAALAAARERALRAVAAAATGGAP